MNRNPDGVIIGGASKLSNQILGKMSLHTLRLDIIGLRSVNYHYNDLILYSFACYEKGRDLSTVNTNRFIVNG